MDDNNFDTASLEEEKNKRRDMLMVMAGVVILGICVLSVLGYFWLGQSSFLAEYFPSATPTQRPTRTPSPNQTPLPNLTATQLAWVKPVELPHLASAEEARTRYEANKVYLESFATVAPEIPEVSEPGDLYIFEIPLPGAAQFPVIWSYGWCASLKEITEDNFKHIQLEFIMDESPASIENFAIIETPYEDGSYCREYAALVDGWPLGQHQLETRVTFTEDVHDGWNLYPAGTHIYKYFVYVEQ